MANKLTVDEAILALSKISELGYGNATIDLVVPDPEAPGVDEKAYFGLIEISLDKAYDCVEMIGDY